MSRQGGRPRRSSEQQRTEVLRRVAVGESDREIAAAVFGDSRYRGRVERIRRQRAPQVSEDPAELPRIELRLDRDAPPADAAYWRELVLHSRRALEQRLEGGQPVAARELKQLLELEQRVANLLELQRLRELTRERPRKSAPDT